MHLAAKLHTSISRSLLAGLACGIIAALLDEVYNVIFINASRYNGTVLSSPVVIFIGIPLFTVIGGAIFYEMVEYVKSGKLLFTLLFLLLMALAIIVDLNRSGKEMKGLVLGIVLITGLLTALLLPFFATHAKIFMDKEDFKESEET